jgi:all-trans-retinol dehydrogenase (NAD+)
MLAGRLHTPFVVLPKTVMLSEMLKGVLLVPTGVRDFIADHVIGVYHTMEDFTGRTEAAIRPGPRGPPNHRGAR